ncbi:coenzyme F420-0:L-glutamate ligase [Micromonospora costi]|uniref:coenzyme F420-0:L-glutamate ligase n=1 Tax=Micromonospora costi TaxID=1530042 RepID=UPI0033F067BB
MKLEILPVLGIGHVSEGDDLPALIATAAPWLRDGDVLVVTSKIVSKAEGRLVDVPADGPERQAARDEVLAAETARVVASRGTTRIVQTHHGFVMATAGIDASNVDKTRLVLLPKDPDASARALRTALRERFDRDVAVIVSDTMGRPWRNGLTDVALGVAGMDAIRDHRGEFDPYGNELQVTQMAVVDELAAAGELIKGKIDQVPVAVVRGYLTATSDGGAGASALVRDAAQDLFSLGTAEARAAGMAAAATLPDGPGPTPADPAAIRRAIDAVADVVAPGTVFTLVADDLRAGLTAAVPGWPQEATALVLGSPPTPVDPSDLVRFGADLHRLRIALAVEGIPSLLLPPPGASTASAALAL